MKNIPSLVVLSFSVAAGAAFLSCTSFSSGPDNGMGGSGSGETGGTTGGGMGGATDNGTGGMTTSGEGGATTGMGGSTTGMGGSTTGMGGSTTGMGGRGMGGMTTTGMGGATGTGGATTNTNLPCDVLNAAGNTCVAAHSTVRQLYSKYTGPLYQVCKGATQAGPNSCLGGAAAMKDIPQVNGYADASVQDAFCTGAVCTIFTIYDQSGMGNLLRPSPKGGNSSGANNPAVATALKLTANGHPAYGVYIRRGQGYRAGCTGCAIATPKGTATGDQPETEYMVTSQTNLVDGCCFDYGNAETTSNDDGNGTMEAVYFGGGVVWGTGAEGGHGPIPPGTTLNPWVMADLENGLFAGYNTTGAQTSAQQVLSNTAVHFNYVTALIVGDSCTGVGGCGSSPTAKAGGRFAIYGGDATSTTMPKTMYDGVRPTLGGYVPMKKQGSIILGTGGDNSNQAEGYWFEGVMASGAATTATIQALQASIAAAKYGQ